MKRIFNFGAFVVAVFAVLSCNQEVMEPVGGNSVTYSVNVPGVVTKAAGDDISNVTELVYEVYRASEIDDLTKQPIYEGVKTLTSGHAEFSLDFVNGQDFVVLFWAQDPDGGMYDTVDLRDVTLVAGASANTESSAAFFGTDTVSDCVSQKGGDVDLNRPVALINLATTKNGLTLGNTTVALQKSSVLVKGLSDSFNVATQEVGEVSENGYLFSSATVPSGEISVNGGVYAYAAFAYAAFAPAEGASVEVSYTILTSEGEITGTVDNVPVVPNYRTNIVGNLISSDEDYDVDLDDDWADGELVEIWDGETLNAPAVNEAGEYVVTKPSEWAYLTASMNPATKSGASDVVVNLAGHLDFGGYALTGLVADRSASLTVKGNGFSISNAKVVSGTNDNGTDMSSLFVSYVNSVLNVENLDIKDIDVTAVKSGTGYAAALVGYVEGEVSLTNVNVYESKIHGTQSIGAVFGYIASYASAEITGCTVDGVKLTNHDVEGESGCMGAFIGRVQGKLTATDIKVSDSVIEAYVATDVDQKRSVAKFIGNFVGGENGVINVTGASLENVTLIAKNSLAESQSNLYTEYIGGWRGNGGVISINGVEIKKDAEPAVDAASELATAVSDAEDGAVIPVSGNISTNSLNASGKTITIVGMSEDAVINSSSARLETRGNINFKNVTISFPTNNDYYGGHNTNGGTMVFDNCKFVGTVAVMNGDVTYNNCEFTNPDKYAAWVYSGKATYNNCTFTGPDRAVKVYAESANAPVVYYNDCTFIASTKTNKTAVEIDCSNRVSGTPYYVEINNPTIENMGVAEHYAIGEGICNLETTGKGLGIVNLNGKGYSVAHTAAQLQALTNAGKDVTIELAQDITGDFTYTQNNDENVVIDGKDLQMNGTIKVQAASDHNSTSTMFVIKNLNFTTTDDARDFINAGASNNYPHLTVSNCTFVGSGADKNVIPVRLKDSKFCVIEDCTASNIHSFINNTAGWNLTIRNCEVTDAGRGISLGTCQNVLVENVRIQASDEKYGIRMDANTYNGPVTIKDCEVSAFIPVVVRNANASAYNLVFDGTNTMTASNTDGYWCAIGTSEYEKNGELPTGTTGAVTVTLNDAGLSASGVYGASNL